MVTLDDIRDARARLGGQVVATPCPHSEVLSRLLGCELYLKLENLQATGSFKDRGALNKILQLSPEQRAAGVITASAGNHAQGVAHAARLAGIRALIVMPETAPLAKVRGTRELGAEILLYGRGYDEAFDKAQALQEARGYTFVHAFDDPQVIAGQGTIGLELLEQVPAADAVIVPVGGGGLLAGIATAMKGARPAIRLVGVQSAALPAMRESLRAGVVTPLRAANTLADGIAVARVGQHTLPILQQQGVEIATVEEEEIAAAVMILLEREKTLAEGAGAVGFAALQQRRIQGLAGRRVVVVISGGNIDMNLLAKILQRGMEGDGRLVRLKVVAPDQPASIARVAELVAQHHAGIRRISQNRSVQEVALEETELRLTLETRGWEHVEAIRNAIREAGFQVK
jgi:threonine dehydratase